MSKLLGRYFIHAAVFLFLAQGSFAQKQSLADAFIGGAKHGKVAKSQERGADDPSDSNSPNYDPAKDPDSYTSRTHKHDFTDDEGSKGTYYTETSHDGKTETSVEEKEKKDGTKVTTTYTTHTTTDDNGEKATVTTVETIETKKDGTRSVSKRSHETYESPLSVSS